MRSDFFVVSTPPADGERFAVLHRDTLLAGFVPWSPPDEWPRAFEQLFRSAEWFAEEDIRVELARLGLSPEEVDDQLHRARTFHTFAGKWSWERTTKIGFRNVHRQEVIRKTEVAGGVAYQRVYVLKCGDCDHQYFSDGCDVHDRRCPRCQVGYGDPS